ncbi:2374_t:CDS:2, partial [Funneliformis caledonium]
FINEKTIPEILSLDLTTSMTADSPPWKRLKVPPLSFGWSEVVLGGLNNKYLLVIGGDMFDSVSQIKIVNEQTLLKYDIQENEWSRITMADAPRDTYLFDTISITWTLLPAPQIPISGDDFSSVLLNDGRLIIIGGFGPQEKKMFSYIDLLASRQIVPQPKGMTDHRRYHTSTLLPNGDVVIVGGLDVTPNVVILETAKDPFQWRIPDISRIETPLLNKHCAELVENRYIFIMFGSNMDNQNIYILDTENYLWRKNRSGPFTTQLENLATR